MGFHCSLATDISRVFNQIDQLCNAVSCDDTLYYVTAVSCDETLYYVIAVSCDDSCENGFCLRCSSWCQNKVLEIPSKYTCSMLENKMDRWFVIHDWPPIFFLFKYYNNDGYVAEQVFVLHYWFNWWCIRSRTLYARTLNTIGQITEHVESQ